MVGVNCCFLFTVVGHNVDYLAAAVAMWLAKPSGYSTETPPKVTLGNLYNTGKFLL